jgi:endonuclease/exonuclease/phosphatase (EEP) superfamily protein YafD
VAEVAGWALVAAPAVTAAARLTRRESTDTILMAEAFGPLLAIPAVGALGLAAATRRRGLMMTAGAVTGMHLAWLTAELRQAHRSVDRRSPRSPRANPASRLRLFSANVLFTNSDLEGIAAEVVAADPDVVVFQEVSSSTLAGLGGAGILDRFPHRSLRPRRDPLGSAVLSRLPLDEVDECIVGGMPMARATVVVGPHRLRIYNVHTRAPFGPGSRPLWKTQLGALADVVRVETGPLVLVGDFNASAGHRPFRALLATGVRDAHMARRRWWVTTWPRNRRLIPPFARIDHVLVSAHLAVMGVAEGEGRGSDHRPVIADLVIVE